jgi:hypothetical protein
MYTFGYVNGDQYSEKESTAEDAKLDNKLKQMRIKLQQTILN